MCSSDLLAKSCNLPLDTILIRSLGSIRSSTLDIVICNPPYVPSEKSELESLATALQNHNEKLKSGDEELKNWREWTRDANVVEAAWVGGEDGIEFFEELIVQALVGVYQ